MATPTRTSLEPQTIVDVAQRLISAHGLGWFSMRKLATELDVNPMTIYLRFANKEELLAAVASQGLASFAVPDSSNHASWDTRALLFADALRAHLVGDRNMLALYADGDRLSSSLVDAVDHGLELMEAIGYRDEAAVLAFRSLFWHVVGYALVQHNFETFPADASDGLSSLTGTIDASTHPTFARHLPAFGTVDGEALFAHSTQLLVAGLRAAASDPSVPTEPAHRKEATP